MNNVNLDRVDGPADDPLMKMSARINAAPCLIESIIDRDQTKMPDYYLPLAPGVLIAGEDMLRATGYWPGRHRPRGWYKQKSYLFSQRMYDPNQTILQVRSCADLWVVERFPDCSCLIGLCALVCFFTLRPIWTRTPQAAMWLAEYCNPIPKPPLAQFNWMKVKTK